MDTDTERRGIQEDYFKWAKEYEAMIEDYALRFQEITKRYEEQMSPKMKKGLMKFGENNLKTQKEELLRLRHAIELWRADLRKR